MSQTALYKDAVPSQLGQKAKDRCFVGRFVGGVTLRVVRDQVDDAAQVAAPFGGFASLFGRVVDVLDQHVLDQEQPAARQRVCHESTVQLRQRHAFVDRN